MERKNRNRMRHEYRVLTEQEKTQVRAVKDKALALYECIESLGVSLESSLAKTRTEEAAMWAVKHITGP